MTGAGGLPARAGQPGTRPSWAMRPTSLALAMLPYCWMVISCKGPAEFCGPYSLLPKTFSLGYQYVWFNSSIPHSQLPAALPARAGGPFINRWPPCLLASSSQGERRSSLSWHHDAAYSVLLIPTYLILAAGPGQLDKRW